MHLTECESGKSRIPSNPPRRTVAVHKKLLRRNDSVILAQLAHFASHTVSSLALFQDEGGTVSFTPMGLWSHMGWLARSAGLP